MAQSLSNILLHLVFSFSTKNRKPWIDPQIESELVRYIAGICREHGCPSHGIGASDDHIHIACTLARTMAISKLLEEIKTSSSKWIKTKGAKYEGFAWQSGYGAFSIGQSQLEVLRRYIANQRQHHRSVSFQHELRSLLSKYHVAFDERYVWD